MKENLLVYVDGDCTDDDVVFSLISDIANRNNLFIKFYGVKESCDFKKIEKMYEEWNIEFLSSSSKVSGKNSTDITITTDLLKCSHDKNITRLLITNDYDYAYPISKMLLDGYTVKVASRHNMKKKYLSSCSDFIDIDRYINLSSNVFCKINKVIFENKFIYVDSFINKIRNKISNFSLELYGFDTVEELLNTTEIREKYFYEILNNDIQFFSVDEIIKLVCDVLNKSNGQLTIDKLLEKINLKLNKNDLELLVDLTECLHIKRNTISVRN